ncbi:MAG: hypothetical protein KJN67_01255, partial [Pontiella sp.]|nr:hypothetical protein [Pontiella sp.]
IPSKLNLREDRQNDYGQNNYHYPVSAQKNHSVLNYSVKIRMKALIGFDVLESNLTKGGRKYASGNFHERLESSLA